MELKPGLSALVTGGASGIGRALCLALGSKGIFVTVVDISDKAKEVVGLVEMENAKFHSNLEFPSSIFVKCDVTDSGTLSLAFKKHLETYGGLDICINNAGIASSIPFGEDQTDGSVSWRRTINVDLTAVIDSTRFAIQSMQAVKKRGVIINVGSAAGLYPSLNDPIYSAAKGGVVLFSRALCSYKHQGIRVNVICPEFLETELTKMMNLKYLDSLGGFLPMEMLVKGAFELITDETKAGACLWITNRRGMEYWPTPMEEAKYRLPSSTLRKRSSSVSRFNIQIPQSFEKIIVQTLSHNFREATTVVRMPLRVPIKQNDVLVKVIYAGVNASDVNFSSGRYFGGKNEEISARLPFDAGFEQISEDLEQCCIMDMKNDLHSFINHITIIRCRGLTEGACISKCPCIMCDIKKAGKEKKGLNIKSITSMFISVTRPFLEPWIYLDSFEEQQQQPSVFPPVAGFGGRDAVGIIAAVGDAVHGLKVGTPAAMMTFGSYAEFMMVPSRYILPIDRPDPEVVAMLTSGLTASIALDKAAQMHSGKVVLVTAAAGGTGQFAVQLAKLAGNTVIATCGGKEKAAILKNLGADRVIDYKDEDIKTVLKKEFPKGVDIVYESVGGKMFDLCLNALAVQGRLIVIGMISQYQGEHGWKPLNYPGLCEKLLNKSQTVSGFFLVQYSQFWRQHLDKLSHLFSLGMLKVKLDPRKFVGLHSVADAVEYLHSGNSVGKVVVCIDPTFGPSAKL